MRKQSICQLRLSLYAQVGNQSKLFELVRKHFKPMQERYGWGTNPIIILQVSIVFIPLTYKR